MEESPEKGGKEKKEKKKEKKEKKEKMLKRKSAADGAPPPFLAKEEAVTRLAALPCLEERTYIPFLCF